MIEHKIISLKTGTLVVLTKDYTFIVKKSSLIQPNRRIAAKTVGIVVQHISQSEARSIGVFEDSVLLVYFPSEAVFVGFQPTSSDRSSYFDVIDHPQQT